MNTTTHNSMIGFIWNIADDVLRDVYTRGKYRDVILPITVLRRLDCILEPTHSEALAAFSDQDILLDLHGDQTRLDNDALKSVTGVPFFNTSPFTMRMLLDEPSKIEANFRKYINGFSQNIIAIFEKFKLPNQIQTLVDADCLYLLIQKFTDRNINLGPDPILADDKVTERLPGLTNRDMGYIFEELIRKFNEENNEEAGEHFTPRDIIQLMTHLIFDPIVDAIKPTTYLLYDDACGSGGMLTEAEQMLRDLGERAGKSLRIGLYGQEVNAETFAICQSDILIKGGEPDNIRYGSTLANDQFRDMTFDFMLANPPYGKSWQKDQPTIIKGSGKNELIDPRFSVEHQGETLRLIPRVSDGQLLFLVNMLQKMKQSTSLGSRIAIVHNGSALFTGDAGQGESNIRRWIIENDWLECIISLPLDMFYNTGIATYIWVLTNRKSETRLGKIQLIDASGEQFYNKLRKNLGKKNCELTAESIQMIMTLYSEFTETEVSKILDNDDFGYRQIIVERPLRLTTHVTKELLNEFRSTYSTQPHLIKLAEALAAILGNVPHTNFNTVRADFEKHINQKFLVVKKYDLKKIYDTFTMCDETAEPVLLEKPGKYSLFEPDSELRDSENVPLKESVNSYFTREVLPYVSDAWIDHDQTRIGYEISFIRYFYHYQPLRTLKEIAFDLLVLEEQTEGLLKKIINDEDVMA